MKENKKPMLHPKKREERKKKTKDCLDWMQRLSRSLIRFETQDIKTQPLFNHNFSLDFFPFNNWLNSWRRLLFSFSFLNLQDLMSHTFSQEILLCPWAVLTLCSLSYNRSWNNFFLFTSSPQLLDFLFLFFFLHFSCGTWESSLRSAGRCLRTRNHEPAVAPGILRLTPLTSLLQDHNG